MTIYLNHNAKGSGLGRKLYTALEEALKAQGILNLYACIGVPEEPDEYLDFNSEQFHAHLRIQIRPLVQHDMDGEAGRKT